MKNIIAGTAGHIDHGKSSLIRALTGIDTDRLEEEKRRGISIDIGFAHLTLPPFHFGFVDVPGHERFVRNMLAGIGGIDMVLLVIAADESIKPQTREHFEICRLLEIPRGIVVLTKSDLVDQELLTLVRLEAEEFVAGSFLQGAPVVPVSSATGAGLDELKAALRDVAARVPGRSAAGLFRLPIDRAFTMSGFGAVVTGTLQSGSVRVEDEVDLHPLGRRLRVRGLQVHGSAVERADAGQRTAINLAGIDAHELKRGMVLASAGSLAPSSVIDAQVQMLPGAPKLKHRGPVHFHAAAAETVAEVRILGGDFVRLLLRDPMVLLPGDRFILRQFSPVVTIGGGAVVDNSPPVQVRSAAAGARAQRMLSASFQERVRLLVEEQPYGCSAEELIRRTGALELAGSGWHISEQRLQQWRTAAETVLREFHAANPLQPGLNREELRTRILPSEAPAFLWERVLGGAPSIVSEGDVLRLVTHRVQLKSEEDDAACRMEKLFRDSGLAVPAVNEVLAASGIETARARALLQMLQKQRRLVRVSNDLYFHADALDLLRSLLAQRKGARFGVAEFKDWTGVSRKYAIPLLEYLDRERVTRREGNERLIL